MANCRSVFSSSPVTCSLSCTTSLLLAVIGKKDLVLDQPTIVIDEKIEVSGLTKVTMNKIIPYLVCFVTLLHYLSLLFRMFRSYVTYGQTL
ncbi:Lipoprotein-releasing system ATP-binding protein LolD [Bienertia sinuspersici]